MKKPTEDQLACPRCHSTRVTLTEEQMFMANTLEHYCHSVKVQDEDSRSSCLDCNWTGFRWMLESVSRQQCK